MCIVYVVDARSVVVIHREAEAGHPLGHAGAAIADIRSGRAEFAVQVRRQPFAFGEMFGFNSYG